MFRYIVRRILQMIPTVLGVILITFILFNVAGGSPATMTLGRHVTPKALEEFDEQRGCNKPLFFGWWTKTRALEDDAFRRTPGTEYVEQSFVRMTNGEYAVPLAFSLRPATTYRLEIEYRMVGGAKAQFASNPPRPAGTPPEEGMESRQSPPLGGVAKPGWVDLEFSKPWKKAELIFQSLEKPSPKDLVLKVAGGALEIRSIQLRRKMSNPLDSQLAFFLKQIAHFDFGMSSSLNQPVSDLLLKGMGPSLIVMTPIFFLGLIVAISIALVCAFMRNTLVDRFFVVLSVALMSINYLVWIIAGQYALSFRMGWFPVWGFASWGYLLLPVLIGVISGLGGDLRLYRTVMLDEMYKDYVRTAFAKGVSKSGVLFKHVLKNAMIPIVTNVILAIPFLYTGSLLLESFFGIPGLGYLAVNAVNSSDWDVIRAEVFIGAVLFVIFNLITDLCYAWLDPRVKLE
jgi:peptide/nickel transport system permease protein